MKLEFRSQSPAILHLSYADPELSKLIRKMGDYTLELDKNYFLKLTKSIVGQQLSIKAKEAIWNRIESLCNDITPQSILTIDNDALRESGLSYAKISYIKGLSEKVLSHEINLETLALFSDEEAIQILTGINGIGEWTAEMFLIFSLGRLDVMSLKDAGLKRAIKWLYDLENIPSSVEINKISNPWKPFRTVASLYLWEIINTRLIYEQKY